MLCRGLGLQINSRKVPGSLQHPWSFSIGGFQGVFLVENPGEQNQMLLVGLQNRDFRASLGFLSHISEAICLCEFFLAYSQLWLLSSYLWEPWDNQR